MRVRSGHSVDWRWLSAAIGVVVVVALLAWQRITPYHPWGDDFAGYLNQARALAEGRAAEEVALNRSLMNAGDQRIGPDAYPWGTPAVLAVAASLVGWDMNALKVVSWICLFGLTVAFLLLCRQLELGVAGTLVCGAGVIAQPWLLEEADRIGSDLPFALLCVVYLNLAIPLVRRVTRGGAVDIWRHALLLGVAALSFTFRSNGGVLVVATLCIAFAGVVLHAGVNPQRTLLVAAIMVTAAGALIGGYFVFLPDGSLVQFGYLTLEPATLVRRAREIVQTIAGLEPLRLLPETAAMLAVVALVPVSLAGALAFGAAGGVLLLTVAGHIALLLMFPRGDGVRYFYPVLPQLVLLIWAGLRAAGRLVAGYLDWSQNLRVRGSFAIQIAAAVGLLAIAAARPDLGFEPTRRGPLSPQFGEVVRELKERLPPDRRVAFFRPRAMRWFSGREALIVTSPVSLHKVDAVVRYRYVSSAAESQKQLTDRVVLASGDFVEAYRNEAFVLYVRKVPAARR